MVDQLMADRTPDLEAWEQAVWQAALQAGAHVLETVLARIGTGRREQPLRCGCGAVMQSVGRREKALTTLLGTVPYSRSLFVCPSCEASCFPGDRQLDIEQTGFSPGVRRRMARAGSRESFGEAEEDLWFYSRIHVSRRDIERIAEQVGQQIECWQVLQPPAPPTTVPTLYVSFDGTAAPMRRGELKGRKGKQADGSAKGREVKVGCVFTQTCLNEEGFPVRDEDSTTYVAGIESSTLFGDRIYHEALGRGLEQARRVIVLTDGAAYNKTIVQMHFPGAQHIIDLYHAREHLHLLADLVLSPALLPAQLDRWSLLLDQGAIEALLKEVQDQLPHAGKRRHEALRQMRYFEKNTPFMRYAQFRNQGLFVGSGVIEAGCRTVVGQRLKQPGMFWSLRGAHAILQIRCAILSRRFEAFWESRSAA
jgi:hypothetical protein